MFWNVRDIPARARALGRKAVIAPATVISGASMLLFCVAPSYVWFVAASIFWGVASSVGGSAPSVYAADSAPLGMNATTMSTFLRKVRQRFRRYTTIFPELWAIKVTGVVLFIIS